MKTDVYDNRVSEAIADIHLLIHPKPIRRHLIGYRRGKRVFMYDSALRNCDIDDICSDPLLRPIPYRRNRVPRPKPQPPLSDSLWYELLVWLVKSLLEILSGERN